MSNPDKRRALAEILLARGLRSRPAAAAGPGQQVKLSRGQRRLWYLEQLYPGTARHNVGIRVDLISPPGQTLVQAALARLQSVHAALRFKITTRGGEPAAEVEEDARVPLAWHDLRDLPAADAEARARDLARHDARRPLDLGAAPLYRASVALLPEGRWQLVLVFHHIIVDGWSLGVLLRDLEELLAGRDIEPPAVTFAGWIADHDEGDPPTEVLRYWQSRFADQPPAATLAPREGGALDRGGLLDFDLGAELTRAAERLARRLGVTSYVVCLAAFKVLLRRMTDGDTIVVGSPAAGREDPRLDRVVGFFARTLALRTEIALDDSFAEVARRVQGVVIDALDHQPMPFDDLVKAAGRSGAEESRPLFRSMFAFHEAGAGGLLWAGERYRTTDLDTGAALFDLTFSLSQAGGSIQGVVGWSERGADAITADAARRAYRALLSAAARDAEALVRDLPLCDDPVDTPPAVERPRIPGARASLADGLLRQAEATPDVVAVIDEAGGALTYAALARRVFSLAARLRKRGVRPGDRVALILERSVDLLVCVHAVTAAGAAYVPLDTGAPAERMKRLLRSSEPALVVVHAPTAHLVPEGRWEVLDAGDLGGEAASGEAASGEAAGEDRRGTPGLAAAPAYLLFTSGSTGEPKLVAFPTDASQVFLDWMQATMPVGPGDKVLLKTPYGFDVSVWELFFPLQRGATVVIARPDGHLDPRYLARLIQREGITLVNFVPSLLEAFLEEPESRGCGSLRWLLSAGEELRPALRDRAHAALAATVVNLYGPTECGAVSAQFLERGERSPRVPIGAALPHLRLHVLDQGMRPLPHGLHGELYVGGELGVATGYWNDRSLTAQRFVPDPLSLRPGLRLYRTGDVCRRLPDGSFEYLGRADRQMKISGVRVDPAEIEAVLLSAPPISAARVAALCAGGERELVAFYTVERGAALEVERLRRHALDHLPRRLVPSVFIGLERLPVNVNGKTDMAALEMVYRDHRRARAASRGAAAQAAGGSDEDQVKAAFEGVLGRAIPDGEESFFELGGSSLLLLKLAADLERRFGRRPGIADLVAHPTVRSLAAMLRARAPASDVVVPLAPAPGAPRVVLLHASSGSVLPYLPLSRALAPSLSVFGVEAPALHGAALPRTVAAFVEPLLPNVEALFDGAPAVLAGWSFGGVLAYELSAALAQRGRAPLATILIDAWVPAEPAAGAPPEPVDAVELLRRRGLFPEDLPERDERAMRRVIEAAMAAFSAYRPSRGVRNPVHLVRAIGGYPAEHVAGYGPDRGWGSFVEDLRVGDARGDHFEVLLPDNVRDLAEEVRRIVRLSLPSVDPG